ncbi:hypothetical protein VFPPC_09791 [Pochonia chlamydosporia 170]|uniref:Uncharacterized protein n=1 Tax=Pochonia chlamydosporia 170 TaxID=1380566 RepID=A0A179FER4_METCM|nr:hypothetical protein VFPPC_09791 [Pochonia chlamydosporia 170]OAQ63549.1 hypothetical protein VFPPC_09791 [Pochonia chlamydosporia 170]
MDDSMGDALCEEVEQTSARGRAYSSTGLLSRLPFMRISADHKTCLDQDDDDTLPPVAATLSSLPTVSQQQKTRRRRGSLRKVALLGRGAQREKRDSKPLTIDTSHITTFEAESVGTSLDATTLLERDALGLKASDLAHRTVSADIPPPRSTTNQSTMDVMASRANEEQLSPGRNSYNSTTDEEELLQIPHDQSAIHSTLSVSSGSDSYYANRTTTPRRRSFQQTKSPLSYSGMSTTALPPPDSDWDYSETEWWGWVVLTVTWFVFVIGMGSCLDVWKWAWDVGKTPYAPPEFEDDETLPIVGYYPALIILTGVMAWVWVVVAWVGMKYFRHAKISGD